MSEKVTIPVSVDADEFWACVLGSSWEVWSWWIEVKYLAGADWDKPGQVKVTIEDPEDEDPEGITATLGVEEIAAAYGKYVASGGEVLWDNLDAASGDAVMQIAVLGQAAYV